MPLGACVTQTVMQLDGQRREHTMHFVSRNGEGSEQLCDAEPETAALSAPSSRCLNASPSAYLSCGTCTVIRADSEVNVCR